MVEEAGFPRSLEFCRGIGAPSMVESGGASGEEQENL